MLGGKLAVSGGGGGVGDVVVKGVGRKWVVWIAVKAARGSHSE